MARLYKVHMSKSGGTVKDVTVVANSQSEAKVTAEAQNPGYKAVSEHDMGKA